MLVHALVHPVHRRPAQHLRADTKLQEPAESPKRCHSQPDVTLCHTTACQQSPEPHTGFPQTGMHNWDANWVTGRLTLCGHATSRAKGSTKQLHRHSCVAFSFSLLTANRRAAWCWGSAFTYLGSSAAPHPGEPPPCLGPPLPAKGCNVLSTPHCWAGCSRARFLQLVLL